MKKMPKFVWVLIFFAAAFVTAKIFYSNDAKLSQTCTGSVLLMLGDNKLVVSRQPGPHIEIQGNPQSFHLSTDRPYKCDVKKIEHVTSVRWPELWIRSSNEQYLKLQELGIPSTSFNRTVGVVGCLSPIPLRPPVTLCQGSYEHSSGLFIKYSYSAKGERPEAQYEIFEKKSREKIQKMLDEGKKYEAVN